MSGTDGWWRSKSTPAKVETYTRWSFHLFTVMEIVFFGLPLFGLKGFGSPETAVWVCLMVTAHALYGGVNASRSLSWVCGRRRRPVGTMWGLGVATVAIAGACLALAGADTGDADARAGLGAVAGGVLIFGVGSLTITMRRRRHSAYLVTGFTLGMAVLSWAVGASGQSVLTTTLTTLLGGAFLSVTSFFSVWLLNAVYELDAARETRARLAVAEERLRFGRDLHDVLGRNLAVIALKSELAVQLARRERPEAVEQMIEVQRIAHESQREVRDVVRGYREAELGVELAGAQGVLDAAGISCEVRGEALAGGLPGAVQSALGWVVREATTNVLRHGDAEWCSVGLRMREGGAVLTVENDGVGKGSGGNGGKVSGSGHGGGGSGGAGSGLAGLRERLAAVGGTLEAGPVGGGRFRLVAEVPLETPVGVGVSEGVG
ncbi:sensor histidine kinase [Streptomyces sp. NPDC059477]|uniref:sensor histidine kinase n=1 Tax=Streptomyces sp. NPDC059477 TaxID=3346847 RepID=UPI0036772655